MEHSFCGNCLEGVIENLPATASTEYKIVGIFTPSNTISSLIPPKANYFQGKILPNFILTENEQCGVDRRFVFHPNQKWQHLLQDRLDKKKNSFQIQLFLTLQDHVIASCKSTIFNLMKPNRSGSSIIASSSSSCSLLTPVSSCSMKEEQEQCVRGETNQNLLVHPQQQEEEKPFPQVTVTKSTNLTDEIKYNTNELFLMEKSFKSLQQHLDGFPRCAIKTMSFVENDWKKTSIKPSLYVPPMQQQDHHQIPFMNPNHSFSFGKYFFYPFPQPAQQPFTTRVTTWRYRS